MSFTTGTTLQNTSNQSVMVRQAFAHQFLFNRDCQIDTVVLLNLILFKAADSSRDIYEVAMQLLQVKISKSHHYFLTSTQCYSIFFHKCNLFRCVDPGTQALPLHSQIGDPAG